MGGQFGAVINWLVPSPQWVAGAVLFTPEEYPISNTQIQLPREDMQRLPIWELGVPCWALDIESLSKRLEKPSNAEFLCSMSGWQGA